MLERKILIVVLKIGITLIVLRMLSTIPMMVMAIIGFWGGSFGLVSVFFQYLPAIFIFAFAILAWFKPSIVLGPERIATSDLDAKEINSAEILSGLLALVGIYFFVESVSNLIWAYVAFQPESGSPTSEFDKNFYAHLWQNIFVLLASAVLILGRQRITRFVTYMREPI